jgi:acyl-coenzyme A thioesterase PaaI-like protein
MPEASSSAPEIRSGAIPTGAIIKNLPASTPRRSALKSLADEVRALITLLSESLGAEEDLIAAADAVRLATEKLRAAGTTENVQRLAARVRKMATTSPEGDLHDEQSAEELTAAEYESHPFFDHSPIAGLGNPLAPPLAMHAVGDEVHATAIFGPAYEGPPGHVHGGVTAAVFDELLGMAQSLEGNPGMTGRLTVSYRKPTPLNTTIRYVGRIASTEGRKKIVTGESYNDETGEMLCTSEGLFIAIDFTKFVQLMAAKPESPGE